MNQPAKQVIIEVLDHYSEQDAIDIGQLLPRLSKKFSGEPIAKDLLEAIIASAYHDQLVARDSSGHVIGIASLTIKMGAAIGREALLEDFVVDPALQGGGIGGKLWDFMIEWCQDHGIRKMNFTSNPERQAAHAFYLKRGAVIYDTSYFKKDIASR